MEWNRPHRPQGQTKHSPDQYLASTMDSSLGLLTSLNKTQQPKLRLRVLLLSQQLFDYCICGETMPGLGQTREKQTNPELNQAMCYVWLLARPASLR